MNTTQPTTSPIVDEGTVRQALDGIGTLAYLKQTDNDVIMIIYDFPRCGMVRFVKAFSEHFSQYKCCHTLVMGLNRTLHLHMKRNYQAT